MGDLIPFPRKVNRDDARENLKRFLDFDLCRCGHFLMKHDFDSGGCYGVDIDDHSIRCPCRDLDPVPEGFFDDED